MLECLVLTLLSRISSRLLHKLLPIDGLRDSVARRRVMQDGLADQEISIAHARHFLHEVDRVELQVVVRLVQGLPCQAVATRPHKELLIHSSNIDANQLFDVLCVAECLLICFTALFELLQNGRISVG